MTEEWVRNLAQEVIQKLSKFENVLKTLDSSYFFPALAAAAREQHMDITSDRARLHFAITEVKRVAKEIIRQKSARAKRNTHIDADVKSRLEYTLPPGDRD